MNTNNLTAPLDVSPVHYNMISYTGLYYKNESETVRFIGGQFPAFCRTLISYIVYDLCPQYSIRPSPCYGLSTTLFYKNYNEIVFYIYNFYMSIMSDFELSKQFYFYKNSKQALFPEIERFIEKDKVSYSEIIKKAEKLILKDIRKIQKTGRYRMQGIDEHIFYEELKRKLPNLNFVAQPKMESYFPDIYIPQINTIIQFNEEYHNNKDVKKRDYKQNNKLRKIFGCNIIRVKRKDFVEDKEEIMKSVITKIRERIKNQIDILKNSIDECASNIDV